MPPLSRRTSPLLGTVGGQPYASSDDQQHGIQSHKENERLRQRAKASSSSTKRMRYNRKTTSPGRAKRQVAHTIEIEDSQGDESPVNKKARRAEAKTQAENGYPSPDSNDRRGNPPRKQAIMVEDDVDPLSSSELDEAKTTDSNAGKQVKKMASGARKPLGVPISPEKSRTQQFEAPKALHMPNFTKPKAMSDAELDAGHESDQSEGEKQMRKMREMQKKSPGRRPNARPQPSNPDVLLPNSSQQRRKRAAAFGKAADRKREREQIQKKAQKAPEPDTQPSPAKKFRTAEPLDYAFPGSSQVTASLQTSFAGAELEGLEADISPLTEISDDELEELGLTEGISTVMCGYCGEGVKKLLQEDFEVEVLKGRQLTYAWQKRFCTWHRKKKAETQWRERRYPQIDWKALPGRIRAHDALLKDIIDDKVESHYRDRLKAKSRKGAMKLHSAVTDTKQSKGGTSMGYYGPRGEKMITDHIIASLSGHIRTRSTKDKLVSASGLQGGVSGFVQAVLAPHVVELLVREDMKLDGDVWEDTARRIIAESADAGELLNPEPNKFDESAHVIALDEDDEGGDED